MFLIRLILLVAAALVLRRLLRRAFAPPPAPRVRPGSADRPARPYRDLGEQDISDADFEEIP
jgi:hypothetical protein